MTDLQIRRVTAGDRQGVLDLLARSLGREADPRYDALFAWKHEENAFGPSPAWVAVDGDRLAGFRVLMRWEFVEHGRVVRAVRAVDTATDPDYQGRGIFTQLALHALDELRPEIDFVFNTPNDQSRPGYLKMGWQVVGRLPTAVRPTGLRGIPRIATARVPADRWSAPSTAGDAAIDLLRDESSVVQLLQSLPEPAALRTRWSPEYLRWRYGTPLLAYRAIAAPGGVQDGIAFFRIRGRGEAREAALCDLIAAGGEAGGEAALTRAVTRAADADYVIRLGGGLVAPGGLVRLPGQGPLLTWRALRSLVPPDAWALSLGDIELF
jgi:GNAT superfamily N-acetyltransferase